MKQTTQTQSGKSLSIAEHMSICIKSMKYTENKLLKQNHAAQSLYIHIYIYVYICIYSHFVASHYCPVPLVRHAVCFWQIATPCPRSLLVSMAAVLLYTTTYLIILWYYYNLIIYCYYAQSAY